MELTKFGLARKDLSLSPSHHLYEYPVEHCRKCFTWNGNFSKSYGPDECEKLIIESVMGI